MVETKPRHGYWKIRGLGHFTRATFAAAGVTEYDDTFYTAETAAQWHESDKAALNHELANLPFAVIDGQTVCESDAIMRTIALKWKPCLLGKTPQEKVNTEMWFSALVKATANLRENCYVDGITAE